MSIHRILTFLSILAVTGLGAADPVVNIGGDSPQCRKLAVSDNGKAVLEFKTAGDFVRLPTGKTLEGKSLTFLCWAKRIKGGEAFQALISKPGRHTSLYVRNHGGVGFGVWLSGPPPKMFSVQKGNLLADRWYLLAGILDLEMKKIRLYANGELLAEAPFNGPLESTRECIVIGRGWEERDGQNFTGKLDAVRVFDKALSQEEIRRIFDQERTGYSPVGQQAQ